jgi:hypothetical protein
MIAISFKSRRYAPEMRLAKIASKPPRTPSGSGSVPNPAHERPGSIRPIDVPHRHGAVILSLLARST